MRPHQVLLLAGHYVGSFARRLRSSIRGLTPEVEAAFRRYAWPGNVRELRNVIERATILEDGDLVTTKYLPRNLAPESAAAARPSRSTSRSPDGESKQ